MPQTWTMPLPDDHVTAVTDQHGKRWENDGFENSWWDETGNHGLDWARLLYLHGPLTDATPDQSTEEPTP